MKRVYDSVLEVIGKTPLIRLNRLAQGLDAVVLVKFEASNPGGSVKDRIGKSMIEQAEKQGVLKPGCTIVEPTSGNTGIGLAMVAAVKGYKIIIVMPETMSIERRKLLQAYGAKVVLSKGTEGMGGAIEKAQEIAQTTPSCVVLQQFKNIANPMVHMETTGPEIWEDTGGEVDVLVAGVGTGGTITGISQYIKALKPTLKAVAVEPENSPVLSGGKAGPHKIQGIGAGFVPEVYKRDVVDEVFQVKDADAIETAKLLSKKEGMLTGISSGAAVYTALQIAKRPESKGKTIVAILPDTGERYLSTELFEEAQKEK
ncbi:MAG: cysteine synthase A [Candidatus Bathyarchaeota archaeon]|nr:cysteine synthase A [Candidatus Bathyarchaeota archaeon]